MSLRTTLQTSKKGNTTEFCLVLWTEEDSYSIVGLGKIKEPEPGAIEQGCPCIVKGHEKSQAQVVGIGVKHDMEKLEDQLTQVNNPIVAIPPPLKRRKVGKENCYRGQKTASAKRTPAGKKEKGKKERGSIITLSEKPAEKPDSPNPPPETVVSIPTPDTNWFVENLEPLSEILHSVRSSTEELTAITDEASKFTENTSTLSAEPTLEMEISMDQLEARMEEMEGRQKLILARVSAIEDILRLHVANSHPQLFSPPSTPASQAPVILPSTPTPQAPVILPSASTPQAPVILPSASTPQAPVILPSASTPQAPVILPSASTPQAPVILPSASTPQAPVILPSASTQSPAASANQPAMLPSSEIDHTELSPVEDVLQKNFKLLGKDSQVGKVACLLAADCVFGKSVLVKCTVHGQRDRPALPFAELKELKNILFKQFPKYWASPQQFEHLWVTSIHAINHRCARLRRQSNVVYSSQ